MPLPPPSGSIRWKDYEIDTPTFRLTPIEKPDMSPFLVHMTGKDEIMGILQGENAAEHIEDGNGYLRAGVPEHSQGTYEAEVVCFTDSPTFALDFFRYRSFRRWSNDQRFGIGFDKATLVDQGVRPAIYADNELVGSIIHLYNQMIEEDERLSEDGLINHHLIQMLKNTYPLLFPLLEHEPRQGYMWEREWRYPHAQGLVFRHGDVRIICCPESEEDEIREVLGHAADRIGFIRAWREYDDVTDYLRRQQPIWREQSETLEQAQTHDERIQHLRDLIQQYVIALNSLSSYQDLILRLSAEEGKIKKEQETIVDQLSILQAQLKELEEKKAQEEKGKKLSSRRKSKRSPAT